MDLTLSKYKSEIDKFCRENSIAKLSLFGSYKKNVNSKKSDIDFLVEFEKGSKIGLLDISRIERELSDILKVKVDLRTPEELSKYFRNSVVKEAEVKYESGSMDIVKIYLPALNKSLGKILTKKIMF